MTGFHPLPSLNLACTGIGPEATEDEWVALAKQSVVAGESQIPNLKSKIENGLRNLHALFSDAPALGSLIDPNQLPSHIFSADYETLKPYLTAALTAEHAGDEVHERAVAAAGMVKAAELLASKYSLVITNVPYLGRGKQHDTLTTYCGAAFPDGKADLATCFVARCLAAVVCGGSTALVTPQNWLFQAAYKRFRVGLLTEKVWNVVARLGEGGFESGAAAGAFTAMAVFTNLRPIEGHYFLGLEASKCRLPTQKATELRSQEVVILRQTAQLDNPDHKVTL